MFFLQWCQLIMVWMEAQLNPHRSVCVQGVSRFRVAAEPAFFTTLLILLLSSFYCKCCLYVLYGRVQCVGHILCMTCSWLLAPQIFISVFPCGVCLYDRSCPFVGNIFSTDNVTAKCKFPSLWMVTVVMYYLVKCTHMLHEYE